MRKRRIFKTWLIMIVYVFVTVCSVQIPAYATQLEAGSTEESAPEESAPEESVPEESASEESVPEESVPEESVPEESAPEESVPEESVPGESVTETESEIETESQTEFETETETEMETETETETETEEQEEKEIIYIDDISIDGDISEWNAMPSLNVGDGSVQGWKATMSPNKSVLYLSFYGAAKNIWDEHYKWDVLDITFKSGTSISKQIVDLEGGWILPGAKVAMKNNAGWNNEGDYAVECALPVNEEDFTITFAGTTVNVSQLSSYVAPQNVEPVYEGIVIDGKYSDWDAIPKTDADCPADAQCSHECISKAAVVFDGDYFYIYLKDGAEGSVANAGTARNGRYAIVSNLGKQITFQIGYDNAPSISGVAGATIAYYGKEWEIAIPKSELPHYTESLSFGLYMADPFISGITNLQGEEQAPEDEFTGIVYDGLYGDWKSYPHTLIQYATPGTGTDAPDGEGALFLDGTTLYGHVVTRMPSQVAQQGGEFGHGVSICFNGDTKYYDDKSWNFYPRLVSVASDGTIDWNTQAENLPNGTHEFYLADIRGEYSPANAKNIADLKDYEKFFGKMIITVTDAGNETEFYVNLEQVATFLSHYSDVPVHASDFKTIQAQFIRIGGEYITIAGTSSGPLMGVALCAMTAGVVVLKRKRKEVV